MVVSVVLPYSVSSVLSSADLVGFSGSRSSAPAVASSVAALVSGQVLVGCARGVDSFFRNYFPSAHVFSVYEFAASPSRGALAARSVAFVQALAARDGVLVSFPSSPCPAGLLPSSSSSRTFCGLGSGSWASLALAIGRGVSCFVYAPFGVPPNWGLVACGSGWFSFTPSGCQLGLF